MNATLWPVAWNWQQYRLIERKYTSSAHSGREEWWWNWTRCSIEKLGIDCGSTVARLPLQIEAPHATRTGNGADFDLNRCSVLNQLSFLLEKNVNAKFNYFRWNRYQQARPTSIGFFVDPRSFVSFPPCALNFPNFLDNELNHLVSWHFSQHRPPFRLAHGLCSGWSGRQLFVRIIWSHAISISFLIISLFIHRASFHRGEAARGLTKRNEKKSVVWPVPWSVLCVCMCFVRAAVAAMEVEVSSTDALDARQKRGALRPSFNLNA